MNSKFVICPDNEWLFGPPPASVSILPEWVLLPVVLGWRCHSFVQLWTTVLTGRHKDASCRPSDRWDNTAPTPSLDESTSTTNWRCGSGRVRMGALVLEVLERLRDQRNCTRVEVRAWRRAAIALKPLTNRLWKFANPKNCWTFVAVWSRPFCNSAHFSQIHLYSSRSYNEAQEWDSFGMKHTFFLLWHTNDSLVIS